MSTTRKYGGTGLGLSFFQRLADLLNGSIDLRSELNVGSEFALRLPLQRGLVSRSSGQVRNLQNVKVGIVAIHPVIRASSITALRHWG